MDIAYCVAMVFILLRVFFIAFLRSMSFSTRIFMEEVCIVALALAVITICG